MAKLKEFKGPPAAPAPGNDLQAELAVAEIGRRRREIARMIADSNDAVARLAQATGAAVGPLKRDLDALEEALRLYCERNRARLTDDGKRKTIEFATGRASWRARPAKVTLRKVAAVVEALKRGPRRLRKFLRTTVEVDKEAMLKDAALARTVKGVSIGSGGEDFAVEPFEIDETATAEAAQ